MKNENVLDSLFGLEKNFQVDQTDFYSICRKLLKMGCCGPNEKERADEIEKGGFFEFLATGIHGRVA